METKLLDLNAYGVEEMSVAEMQENGGGWLLAAAGLAVGVAAVAIAGAGLVLTVAYIRGYRTGLANCTC